MNDKVFTHKWQQHFKSIYGPHLVGFSFKKV